MALKKSELYESDYSRIAEYMADNPRRWAEDSLRPDNVGARHAVPPRNITGSDDE